MADSPSTKAPADSTTTTTTTPTTPQDKVKAASVAFNHFSQGKRHMLVEDFKSAVSSFKQATEALVELYGEQAPECGDAYYHFGHALLELARKEAGVLGQDLDGGSSQEGSTEEDDEEEEEDEETEESQEEEEGEGKKEGEENADDAKKDESEKAENGDKEGQDEKSGETKGEESKKAAGEKSGEVEGEKSGEAEGEKSGEGEGEEEVTTLQCAWEWLDSARLILDKQDRTPETAKKLAQIHLSLGQVCMEGEDYEGAINEFKKCLDLQESVLAKDDRSLAETHYQLGLVNSLADGFDDAITHFSAAVEVIKLKIENLKAGVEERKTWTQEQKDKELAERKDVFYTKEGEIEDLEQLLPDIQDKITDMQEMKAASKERLQQTARELLLGKGELAGASGSAFSQAFGSSSSSSGQDGAGSSSSSGAKPTMLQVRRKRKPEEDGETDPTKKAKLENGVKSEGAEAEKSSDVLPPQDLTKQPSDTLPKPIAVKRKVTQNGKESPSAESSSTKCESSTASKTDKESSSASTTAESSSQPQKTN